jgi:dihydrofolate reductase
MRASVFIAVSLDGFIARENGDLDWLPPGGAGVSGEDYGYKAFFDTVDILVMGRRTFEKVLVFGQWPYGEKPVVVLSSGVVNVPERVRHFVDTMAGSPGEVVDRLSARGAKHLYIDGGSTIQRFLGAGLIDRMTITTIPILIGKGIPLFGPLPHDVNLHLVEIRQFPNGLIQSTYDIERQSPHS